jgi:hypothetical protein
MTPSVTPENYTTLTDATHDFQLTRILTYVERPDPAHFVSCIDEPKAAKTKRNFR